MPRKETEREEEGDHQSAQGDAVNPEGAEVLFPEEAHEPPHAEEGDRHRGDHAGEEEDDFLGRRGAAAKEELRDFEQAGAHHDGDGQIEGELGGGRAAAAQKQSAQNGDSAARGTGDQGQDLEASDEESVLQAQREDGGDPFAPIPLFLQGFDHQEGNPIDDEGAGDDGPILHRILPARKIEDQPHRGGRQYADEDLQPCPPDLFFLPFLDFLFRFLPALDQAILFRGQLLFAPRPKPAPKQNDDRQDGAKLNDDKKKAPEFLPMGEGFA